MARQCTKPKRKSDATWFREKVLLVEAQGNGKVLNEEELEFSLNLGIAEGPVTQSVITHNTSYQAYNLDAYDSDCDEISTAKATFPLLEESSHWQYNFPLPVEGVPTARRMKIPLLKSLHCYDEETASQRELAVTLRRWLMSCPGVL
nr:hypothetical protein [Tanacetum cinerariifolium]